MTSRLNNPESCICCSRRADGMAVGRPGKLGWFCNDCGAEMAKVALNLIETRKFDVFEQRAAARVADLIAQQDMTLSKDELPDFIKWAVQEFSTAIRAELESGRPPF